MDGWKIYIGLLFLILLIGVPLIGDYIKNRTTGQVDIEGWPPEGVEIIEYEIEGETCAELVFWIFDFTVGKGPLSEGRRWGSETIGDYNISMTPYTVDIKKDDGKCEIWGNANITIDMPIIVVIPRWRTPQNADKKLIEEWERSVAAIKIHELDHINRRKDALKQANEFLSDTVFYGVGKNCNEARAVAQSKMDATYEAVDQIFKRAIKEDIEYDNITKHGVTQGAILNCP